MFLLVALATLAAANVDSTLLGPATGPPPLAAADAQGNLLLVGSVPCSILQECQPITLVKVDPSGRILFRRGLGDASWRFQPSAVTFDRDGNILLAGTTSDATLPTVRPLQQRAAGSNDIFLLALSPDATRTLFATYFGGSAAETLISLQADGTGSAVLTAFTASADFPFTLSDGPVPGGPAPRFAAIRIAPAAARLIYAANLPGQPTSSNLHVSPDGTALVAAFDPNASSNANPNAPRAFALEIRPDGARHVRPYSLPADVLPQRTVLAPDGSLWLAGQVFNGVLPPTANAWQRPVQSASYLRAEGAQVLAPPGLMTSLTARLLAVDRADDNILYAATTRGLSRTTDNGWTWELVNETPPFRTILALAASAGRLWVLTLPAANSAPPALQYSDDGGATWVPSTFPIAVSAGPLLLAAHPTNKAILYTSAGGTLYRTSTAGETWLSRNFPDSILTALAVDAAAVAWTTAGQTSPPGLYLSTDGGDTLPERAPLTVPGQSLRFDPNQPGSLYFGDGPRLLRTSPAQFPRLEELALPQGPLSLGPFVHFGFQNGLPGALLALSFDGTLHRSEDGGRTFRLLTRVASPGNVSFPSQFQVAAGGVVHMTFTIPPEPFIARLAPDGTLAYLSYLGIRRFQTLTGLHVLSNGQVVATGQLDNAAADFPGEVLRGSLPGTPAGFVPPSTAIDIFAVAFQPDGQLAYAVTLAGVGPDALFWSGAGPTGSLLLFGNTFSPDFPGLTGANSFQPSLFFTRVRP